MSHRRITSLRLRIHRPGLTGHYQRGGSADQSNSLQQPTRPQQALHGRPRTIHQHTRHTSLHGIHTTKHEIYQDTAYNQRSQTLHCRTSLGHANPKNHHITVRNNISRSSITASSFLKKHSPSLTRVDTRTPHAWGGLSYRSADTAGEHVKILKVAFRFEAQTET